MCTGGYWWRKWRHTREPRTLSCTSGCPGYIFRSMISADIHYAVSCLKGEYSLHLPASRNKNATVAWNRDKERTAIPDRLPVGILELVLCSLGSRQLHHCNRCKFSLQQPAKAARRLLKAQLKSAYLLWLKIIFACKTTSVLKYLRTWDDYSDGKPSNGEVGKCKDETSTNLLDGAGGDEKRTKSTGGTSRQFPANGVDTTSAAKTKLCWIL